MFLFNKYCVIFVSTLSISCYYLLQWWFNDTSETLTIMRALEKMIEIEKFHQRQNYSQEDLHNFAVIPTVAVGVGSCWDISVDALQLFSILNATPPVDDVSMSFHDQNNNHLTTLQDLVNAFAYYFVRGAAVERYVENEELFGLLVNTSVMYLKTDSKLGGNAPVIANRLALEGANVILGAQLSKRQLEQLHSNVKHVGSITATEDVHLILEYDIHSQWGHLHSPRANRFIVTRDRHNPYLKDLDQFREAIREAKPHLVVISGLHMMENFPFQHENERIERLDELRTMLEGLDEDTRIHFELASFSDATLFLHITETIIPLVDSIGMNEQELPNLFSAMNSDTLTSSSSSYPRTAEMLQLMRNLWKLMRTSSKDRPNQPRRQLSRLHLHSLGYQVIFTKVDSNGRRIWSNTRRAAVRASLMGHRYTCDGPIVDIKKSKLLMDNSFAIFSHENSPRIHFNTTNPVAMWTEGDLQICVAPMFVCTQVKKTAGCGDNISACGLFSQLQPED